MYYKIVLLTFRQTCVYNFFCNTNICILLNHLKRLMYSKKQSQYLYLVLYVANVLCPNFHFILWIPSERLMTRFDKEFPVNFELSRAINKLQYARHIFVICPPSLSILVTYFSTRTAKVMYMSAFSPNKVNCFSNSSASTFMKKW